MAEQVSTPGSQGSPYVGSSNVGNLSAWAGPGITDMLGRATAASQTPYQVYGGPLTAGASDLQDKVFQGLGSLNFPSNLGQSFTSAGTPTPGTANASGATTGGTTGSGIASQYMNPYLQNVLDPQMKELQRQNDIANMNANAKLTQAGGFGGGRQAVMNAENTRNMMAQMNKTLGEGYSNAYDKAMGQFNTEQGQAKTLADMMSQAGATQRDITSEGVKADLTEFEKQRLYPQQQLEWLSKMYSGLPISSVSNVPGEETDIGKLSTTVGSLGKIYDDLKKFGLI